MMDSIILMYKQIVVSEHKSGTISKIHSIISKRKEESILKQMNKFFNKETAKRIVDDMGYPLSLVSTFQRKEWIENKFKLEDTIYMGDGIYDILVFDYIGFSIAPANAFFNTKLKANFVTNAKGGEGAVAEACVYIFENILELNFNELIRGKIVESGIWKNIN